MARTMMQSPATETVAPTETARRTERRIALFTLALGGASALAAAAFATPRAGVGVAVGTLLAWLNLRWLVGAADAVAAQAGAQAGAARPRVSVWVYAKLLLRYVLIGLGVYVMLSSFHVPALSIFGGLCTLGPAAIAAALLEALQRRS